MVRVLAVSFFSNPGARLLTILGYTDLPSRLPTQSSTLYSNNITKFLLSLADKDKGFHIDLNDEVTRGAIVSFNGEILPPPPPPTPPPTPAAGTAQVQAKEVKSVEVTPWQKATRQVATVTAGMGSALALGKLTGPAFMGNMFTFGLAGLVGYRAVWGVVPALHSPLMSVTNAISGQSRLDLLIDLVVTSILTICRNGWYRRSLRHGWRLSANYHP